MSGEHRYDLLPENGHGIRRYGKWMIYIPVEDDVEWCWWREDDLGNHLPGTGVESSLEAAIAAINKYEDAS